MSAALAEHETQVKRSDVNVKMDAEVARDCKLVAGARGISIAEYLSELVRPLVRRDLEAERARRLRTPDPKRRPKGE